LLGVTVETSNEKFRIKHLINLKAQIRFLSCEPLVQDLGEIDLTNIDWVIVGGESGTQARRMEPNWVRSIQRQSTEQEVAFFFKQWGTWGSDGIKRTKKANGMVLD
jgi:protein gp37